jgi:hypothetical protein
LIEIIEILHPAQQGRTTPWLCKGEDGFLYYVKGHRATPKGLAREWLGAHLAKAFGLPTPEFLIVNLPSSLLKLYRDLPLRAGEAFASRLVPQATDFIFDHLTSTPESVKKDIFLFDFWVQNEDRTLSELGGNPNLLWCNQSVVVIDHNLIFPDTFSLPDFIDTHVFSSVCNPLFSDMLQRKAYQSKLDLALTAWPSAWTSMPEEWQEDCQLNEEQTKARLTEEADGAIWTRLIQ